jgi:stalled ribosome alternative rescue factor ArfA
MKPKPKKRNTAARALTSALFRQRKRPSKKLYRRRARTKNAGMRDQAGVLGSGVDKSDQTAPMAVTL